MTTNRNSEHLRYRYGICLNDNCPKCKNKEVQQIVARREFVCVECGKPLRECPPPKKRSNKLIIFIITAIVIICAAIALFLVMNEGDDKAKLPASPIENSIPTDTISVTQIADTIETANTDVEIETKVASDALPNKEENSKEKSKEVQSNGKLSLSYGTYIGDLKNGYPEGMGRLTYNTSRVINKYDQKGRQAKSGEYVIGEFQHGYFIQGKHYSSEGTLIQTLMIGVPASLGYESK